MLTTLMLVAGFAAFVAALHVLTIQNLPFLRTACGIALLALANVLSDPAAKAFVAWAKAVLA